MIPQSKAFASERENLQKVSSSLLQLKFTQTAKSLLSERNQTFSSISKAVSYLSKAVNLDPKNTQLQMDLRNAELYQISFQYYADMNWGLVIENLKKLLVSDNNYANGNAKVLLYEAYYALGHQYYAVGVYEDARSNLEEAEILAYENGFNQLKLFQVQMLLGDTIARMGDSANAVSYYQYALNSINAYSRASGDADLTAQLMEAEALAASGFTRDAAASYYQIHQTISRIYTIKEVEAVDGTSLAFFADQNASTSEAIIEANGLPQSSVISFGRKIKVPTLN
jgi:tetratricopeptide (TPR) repeat protein